MCGLYAATGKTLVTYSDIIFDRQIPELLLKSSAPITLVVDRAFHSLPRRDKSLDLDRMEESFDRPFLFHISGMYRRSFHYDFHIPFMAESKTGNGAKNVWEIANSIGGVYGF